MLFNIIPVPASRPRVTKRGIVYYNKTYEQFREQMKILKLQYKKNILTCPLAYAVVFYCPIPKSITIDGKVKKYTKQERADMVGMPAVQFADKDNLEKALFDSLEGWFFENDKQLCKTHQSEKIYSDRPRIEFNLYTMEP